MMNRNVIPILILLLLFSLGMLLVLPLYTILSIWIPQIFHYSYHIGNAYVFAILVDQTCAQELLIKERFLRPFYVNVSQ